MCMCICADAVMGLTATAKGTMTGIRTRVIDFILKQDARNFVLRVAVRVVCVVGADVHVRVEAAGLDGELEVSCYLCQSMSHTATRSNAGICLGILTPLLHVRIPTHPPPHLNRIARKRIFPRTLHILPIRTLKQPLRPTMPMPPVKRALKRVVSPAVITLRIVLHQHIRPRLVIPLVQPLRIQIPNNSGRVNKICVEEVMVVVVRIPEIGIRIREASGGDDAFPAVVVVKRITLLIFNIPCEFLF